MDNFAVGSIARVTLGRAANHLVTVIAVAGEILGIKTEVCVKGWRL